MASLGAAGPLPSSPARAAEPRQPQRPPRPCPAGPSPLLALPSPRSNNVRVVLGGECSSFRTRLTEHPTPLRGSGCLSPVRCHSAAGAAREGGPGWHGHPSAWNHRLALDTATTETKQEEKHLFSKFPEHHQYLHK